MTHLWLVRHFFDFDVICEGSLSNNDGDGNENVI